jgi:hypothetical protein
MVIPKFLRDRLEPRPGEVDGVAVHVEPVAEEALEERGDRLVIPATGAVVADEAVRALRAADQR